MLVLLSKINWTRIALILSIASLLFAGGYQAASIKHAEHAADVEKQKNYEITKRIDEITQLAKDRLKTEQKARAKLQDDFNQIRDRESILKHQIREARLIKPVATVNIESCLEVTGENETKSVHIIANPFNVDFVRLYNNSSRASGNSGTF